MPSWLRALFRSPEESQRRSADRKEALLHAKAIRLYEELARALGTPLDERTFSAHLAHLRDIRAALDETEAALSELGPRENHEPIGRLALLRLEHANARLESEKRGLEEVLRIREVGFAEAEKFEAERRRKRNARKRRNKRR
jgi:hypothetical protein